MSQQLLGLMMEISGAFLLLCVYHPVQSSERRTDNIKIIYSCFWRLYRHPLAKYPGPIVASLTDWYAAWHAYNGDLHIKMKEAHDKYGSVVRFGPNRLMCNTTTGLNAIYKARNVSKSQVYSTLLASNGAWHTFNILDKGRHAKKNRIMRQGVTEENLFNFEPMWLEQAMIFIDRLTAGNDDAPSQWSEPRNVAYYADCMTMDIMGIVVFGRHLHLQSRSENRYMIDVLAKLQRWNSTHIQSLSLAKLNLDKLFYPQQLYYGRKMLEQVRVFVEERTESIKQAKNDIFSFIVDATDPQSGEKMPLVELWSEAKLLLAANADQTATTIAIILFYLSRNPSQNERLVREIRSHFSESSEIRAGSVMDSCHYLHACIKESLRISPPTGGSLWRQVDSGTLDVDGHTLFQGCDIGTSIYAIHHNEKYFPASYTFLPERWLGEYPPQDLGLANDAWTPFSLGMRICLGRNLALMEIADIIALIVWHLDFRVSSDAVLARVGEGTEGHSNGRHRPHEFQLRDHITSQIDGPFLEFRRRLPEED